jgi:hypothetical protein
MENTPSRKRAPILHEFAPFFLFNPYYFKTQAIEVAIMKI